MYKESTYLVGVPNNEATMAGVELSPIKIWEQQRKFHQSGGLDKLCSPVGTCGKRNSLGTDSDSEVTSREMSVSDRVDTSHHRGQNLCKIQVGTPSCCDRTIVDGTIKSLQTSLKMMKEAVEVGAHCSDVDTMDSPPRSEPIHIMASCNNSRASDSDSKPNFHQSFLSSFPSSPNSASRVKNETCKPRLTLSAFRRPEHTVRLTESDASRCLEDEYDLRSPGCGVLGHGAFSTVRLGIRRSDHVKVAVKSIAKHDALRARRLRRGTGGRRHLDEWEILLRMRDHPHVITFLDLFETNEEIHLVTEYCEGGELFDAIQKKRIRQKTAAVRRGQFSEPDAARITSQILTALRDLHAKNIVHRDVKPENILLVSDSDVNIHAKLCDFGMARLFREEAKVVSTSGTSMAAGCGSDGETSPSTPPQHRTSGMSADSDYYAAPEAYHAKPCPTAADIYSLGVTLYILLCGFPPVFSDTDHKVVFPQTHWASISEQAKSLIRNMLCPEPVQRITAKDALQDEWIEKNVQQRSPLPETQQLFSPSMIRVTGIPIPKRPSVVATTPVSPNVNLELVRRRLYKALLKEGKDLSLVTSSRKRNRRSGSLDWTPKSGRRNSFDWTPRRSRRSSSLDWTPTTNFRTPSSLSLSLSASISTPRRKRRFECVERRTSFDFNPTSSSRKKVRISKRRASDALVVCAMADLYCAAKNTTTTVADLKKQDVRGAIEENLAKVCAAAEDNNHVVNDGRESVSPSVFASPLPAVSV